MALIGINRCQKNWNCWYNQLQGLCEVNIPRWYFRSRETPQSLEIHVFCDSSQTAYGTVIYLRFTVSSEIRTAFVIAKGKVAPLKKMTLPRLELMAAVIGVRLLKVVQEQFPDAKARLWTDSSIVLYWIRGSAYRSKTFVKNRVSEIKESTSPRMWYHCPCSDNPADKITRGVKIKDLVCDSVWAYGPSWLSESEENWPDKNSSEIALLSSCDEERCDMTPPVVKNCEIQPILCISKFSKIRKLVRVTSYVFRFINILKTKQKCTGPISVLETEKSWEY
ncbi:uncharacterized protein [Parasteatoda tepidariorum]|uniref:uncharacterized protein n=1 Tax=Parasteatoda tepidariorum TaxID=114398 RepID=UPI0039BC392D